jgi:EAL domain-containing protein (putative c-di-GMP-specific phosphodiesterase class I)
MVSLTTQQVVGHEALARWTDDELGTVAPDEFILAAERAGLIGRLGSQVLEHALEAAALWPSSQYVSVNLSVSQLHTPTLADEIEQALAEAGVPPSRLVVEVTESRVMRDPERATAMLRDLRSLGIRIAMDDFGTGQSSLALLHDLPLDVLKIDRAFIRSVDTGGRARSMVAAILGICDELGLVTVAEGVETASQRDALAELGCAVGQGWLFGRAVAHRTRGSRTSD